MASVEESIVSILESDAAVTAAAPGGIWPRVLPTGVTLPALRFLTPSDMPVIASDGRTGTHKTRVQVDACARSWGEALALEQAVMAALCPTPNVRRTVNGYVIDGVIPDLGRDDFETATKLYLRGRDFFVWGGLA